MFIKMMIMGQINARKKEKKKREINLSTISSIWPLAKSLTLVRIEPITPYHVFHDDEYFWNASSDSQVTRFYHPVMERRL